MGFRSTRMNGTSMRGSVVRHKEPTAMNWTPDDDTTRDEVMQHGLFDNEDDQEDTNDRFEKEHHEEDEY